MMRPSSPMLFVSALILTLVLAGCKHEDRIRTYTVAKEAPDARPAGQGGHDHAMHRPAPIDYEVPEGWKDHRHEEGMRFATLLAEEGGQQLEVSIIPLSGGAGGVVANLQRWRGQLGLGEATEEELEDQITRIQGIDGTPGFLIDMTGPGPEGNTLGPQRMLAAIFMQGGRSWFIKTMGDADFIGPYRDEFEKLCKSVHFDGGSSGMQSGAQAPEAAPEMGSPEAIRLPDWEIPETWQKEAEPRPFSRVSYLIEREEGQAVMTVSPLASAPQLLPNVNRWRRQVGLMPVEHLKDSSTPVTISGQQGVMVDLEGEEEHILGLILPHGGVTWFFKLMGPPVVVNAEAAPFESFVESLRFVEDVAGE